MTVISLISSSKCFGGLQKIYSHQSKELACEMKFAVFLPPTADDRRLPVLYWLSGLTCNETNFIQKAGAQRYATEHNLIIVCPDTSPRNVNIPGEDDSWDFGSGAGFYIDATKDPWSKHYRMFSYVTQELIDVVNNNFPTVVNKMSIAGHSMGGHGALICALKNPGLYKSVSAFAAISNPTKCPWGQKIFSGYLGEEKEAEWKNWDATELVASYNGPPLELYLDQGSEDSFLKDGQLNPQNLVDACRAAQVPCVLNMRDGYDHSYFYVASFIGDHIAYHARHLQ
ncbi:S-formylglutathione hydrolase [Anopheles moucheti]|uniref:S-formylglutathione hydrolase n=1 Tax=Anopheles moucheti TaxID=186751 RepID=UPI0022F0BDA6|nr:S-formylglutathione hydrolase [Anopheles moucheti]XP_052898076.1 S-formylglutathione hydrolase [Anopheles moucheti]